MMTEETNGITKKPMKSLSEKTVGVIVTEQMACPSEGSPHDIASVTSSVPPVSARSKVRVTGSVKFRDASAA